MKDDCKVCKIISDGINELEAFFKVGFTYLKGVKTYYCPVCHNPIEVKEEKEK